MPEQSSSVEVNKGLSPARNAINTALLGLPVGHFTSQPQEPTDPEFCQRIGTAEIGPIAVTGLTLAFHPLRNIMAEISAEQPEIYRRLGCSEMLSCRFVKGSSTIISNHSWGIALDLTVDGKMATDGQDDVMEVLSQIGPIFNRNGFYWGISFGLADALHFEASDQLLRSWAGAGLISGGANITILPRALNLGDRGPHVLALQRALNTSLFPVEINCDGQYGPMTRFAVQALQRKVGLPPTGAAPKPVLTALGLD